MLNFISDTEARELCGQLHCVEPTGWNELAVTLPNGQLGFLHRIPLHVEHIGIDGVYPVDGSNRWAVDW
jgi:hypothetical protein